MTKISVYHFTLMMYQCKGIELHLLKVKEDGTTEITHESIAKEDINYKYFDYDVIQFKALKKGYVDIIAELRKEV